MNKNAYQPAKVLTEAVKDWPENAPISAEETVALGMFGGYHVNLLEQNGMSYRGFSWREGSPLTLLVVKANINGTGVVTFVSGRHFPDCVRIYIRRLEERTLEWRNDKFA